MSRFLDNCRLIEPTGVQLFLFLGCSQENETAPVGAVGKVKTPPPLRNFQAQWESLAFGLFHEASFSIALLPTDTAIEPQNQSNNDLSPPLTYFNVQESSTIPAFYVQDEYSIKKNLIFSGGVRYDHYARFGGSANPRLALIYSPWARTSIKLLYGQAFRVPSPYELFLASNAALTPESIKTPEVALEHYFSQHLQLSASAYYNLIDKLIIQQTDPSGNIQFTNQGSVH